jgi:hypothetical protein
MEERRVEYRRQSLTEKSGMAEVECGFCLEENDEVRESLERGQ